VDPAPAHQSLSAAPAVAAFLRDTYAVVAPGRERVRVDDFLAEVIAES
jgi:hypothetical protein